MFLQPEGELLLGALQTLFTTAGNVATDTQAANACLRDCEEMHFASVAGRAEDQPPPDLEEAVKAPMKTALALAEASVSKLAAVPCQDLLEMVVQLQLCLGLPATTLPTILPEQRVVAQVRLRQKLFRKLMLSWQLRAVNRTTAAYTLNLYKIGRHPLT